MEQQVISKKRVADHGEVLTGKREVNAMLDLVKQETERIESRFLEPACGTGNFLTEILARKLRIVESRYRKSQLEWERNAICAVSSVYGIDILQDNVIECRRRLLDKVGGSYGRLFKDEFMGAVAFILKRNIIWGNALTYRTVDSDQPIVFSEWSPFNGSQFIRRDFKFERLISCAAFEGANLFSDLGDLAFIPEPVKDYPPTHYLRLADAEH